MDIKEFFGKIAYSPLVKVIVVVIHTFISGIICSVLASDIYAQSSVKWYKVILEYDGFIPIIIYIILIILYEIGAYIFDKALPNKIRSEILEQTLDEEWVKNIKEQYQIANSKYSEFMKNAKNTKELEKIMKSSKGVLKW